ncbi:HNH endonuclease [Denitratimonas sp. CY0512]|uniref:HNH endonuclease n=1 Tax=Denitratimonas sp. CY0512 TaxID=3131940 RepID=UPI0030B3CFD4
MAFWWVNHKQTRDHEVLGGYLWSPFRNANGAYNQTYENMRHVKIGDIVFSYGHGQIGAIGRVTALATPSPKPTEFGAVGKYWDDEGWLVEVDFIPAPTSLVPSAHMGAIGPLLPEKYSPIKNNGRGNQGCYLAGIPDALGYLLMALTRADELEWTGETEFIREAEPGAEVLEDLSQIESDESVPVTQRIQLAKARVGQGIFRKRVILLDERCRVTGVDDRRVLIASHIKSWKDSTNEERISGYNGILLSPHVDALFDSHLITFEGCGKMHAHASLSREVLERWSINPAKRVTPFHPEQLKFLDKHQECFRRKIA